MADQEFPKFISEDPKLEQALAKVRESHDEAEKFASDPASYLQAQGIETESLMFGPAMGGELDQADLELVAGGAAPIVCVSVGEDSGGERTCVSVGEEQM